MYMYLLAKKTNANLHTNIHSFPLWLSHSRLLSVYNCEYLIVRMWIKEIVIINVWHPVNDHKVCIHVTSNCQSLFCKVDGSYRGQ